MRDNERGGTEPVGASRGHFDYLDNGTPNPEQVDGERAHMHSELEDYWNARLRIVWKIFQMSGEVRVVDALKVARLVVDGDRDIPGVDK